MGYKMNGFSGFGNSPAKAHKPGHKKEDVTSKSYGIQNVSKVQENKKGKFITGLNKDFVGQGGTSDTTYLPKKMKHYSGKEYKKGDHLDETDFEEKIGKK